MLGRRVCFTSPLADLLPDMLAQVVLRTLMLRSSDAAARLSAPIGNLESRVPSHADQLSIESYRGFSQVPL